MKLVDAIRRAGGVIGRVIGRAIGRTRSAVRAGGRLVTEQFWPSVRPTTRRGAVLGVVGIVAGAALLAGVFFVGAVIAWSPYLETTLYPDANARAWAALDATYATASMCTDCHAPEAEKATSARHAGIGCQSCHGALLEHALTSSSASDASPDEGTPEATFALEVPTDDICVTCHAGTVGRPDTVLQVVPSEHYVSVCLQCHDPHTGISRRPLVVLHTLENLPECVTCHGPEGFKARNQRHPDVADDELCLDCHGPGRGPEEVRWPH